MFDAAGPLARAFDRFEPRAGQRRLASAIAGTFTNGGTLVAEAGTGTGKTLAYLIPAILAGRKVLISTGTRTLQDQVFYKDIPAVSRALGQPIRAAYMKGRTNYLCRHRFGRLQEAASGLAHDDRRWLTRISEWAGKTETGDRAEIEDLPDELPFWSEVTATREQCLGRECPEHAACFVTRMRDAAAEAQIVIVNHHLLCADAAVRDGNYGEVIPDCDLAVLDEAHQLEDVVTQYFGIVVGTFRLEQFLRDADTALAAIPPDEARRAMAIKDASEDVAAAARRLFDLVRLHAPTAAHSERWLLTAPFAAMLHDVHLGLREAIDRLAALLPPVGTGAPDLAAIRARADALTADLLALSVEDDPRYVRFAETRGRGVFLRAAPLDASAIIRDRIVGSRAATVLTSATLAVEGSLEYALTRFGLPDASTVRLPSEFDYARQALLYLPDDLPDPRSRDFNRAAAERLVELLERTRGRAFVLFTSYAALRDVHGRLQGRVPWPLLVQGTAPRPALLRDFRATPHAVLLATASFWQGVDVAGDALSAVIVDRLPFAPPADPLIAARMGVVEARGGHPFNEYQVPLATLALRQGLGRLIRSRSDRGLLAVLDPRLTQMRYGQRFLASLPPAPVTSRLADVARFFKGAPDGEQAGEVDKMSAV